MYRPPGRSHMPLDEALDELFMRIEKMEGYLRREGAPGKMFPPRNFFLQLLTRVR